MSPLSRIGVTFMEVVYVLVIIAFLAAVLFPVFQHPISNSPRTSCQSDLKQLGLAYIQYEQDNDNTFPAGVNAAGNGWAGQLYPFVKSTGIYQCPSDMEEGKFISYAENQNLVHQSYANLPLPTATVEIYEFTTLGCDPSVSETVSTTGLSAPQTSKRHDQRNFPYALNFLFADGHIKYLTPEKVSGGPNAFPAKMSPKGAYVETFAVR